jgi:hypothetical protein
MPHLRNKGISKIIQAQPSTSFLFFSWFPSLNLFGYSTLRLPERKRFRLAVHSGAAMMKSGHPKRIWKQMKSIYDNSESGNIRKDLIL